MNKTKWSRSDTFHLLQTISSFLLVIGIFVGVATFRLSRNQQRFQIAESFYQEWNSPRFGEIQKEFSGEPISVERLIGNKVVLCNFFERIGLYESEKIIKVEYVYKMFGNLPCTYWELVKDAVRDYRRIQDKPGYPPSWRNFENLCRAINKFHKRKLEKGNKNERLR